VWARRTRPVPLCSAALLATLLTTPPTFAGECARPTDPGGGGGYDYGTAMVSSFGNARVLVWYTLEGEHAVNSASSRADHVPRDVVTVAAVTSDALASYAAMGLRAPLSDALSPSCGSNGGDARFDVYLVKMRGADGMTVVESDRCASVSPKQCASYLVAKSNYAEIYDTAELGIRTVLPHETFHAVQNAYDVDLERFWAEGSAQWAAKTLDPALTDLERNLTAFFSQSARSLDAPPSGVTAAFLYGSAIWPVFLSQRYGDDIVRSILEQEAEQGDSAIAATDLVLHAIGSSLADEFPLFAAWNSATGRRTGTGGYLNAVDYPEVELGELATSGSQAITSGLASFYYHAQTEMPTQVSIDTDSSRNRGLLVPFEDGLPRVDRLLPLPAELNGEGIVVVSGITTSKKDAPFKISSRARPLSSTEAAGCSLSRPSKARQFPALLAFLALLLALRRVKARGLWSVRVARAADKPSPSPR